MFNGFPLNLSISDRLTGEAYATTPGSHFQIRQNLKNSIPIARWEPILGSEGAAFGDLTVH